MVGIFCALILSTWATADLAPIAFPVFLKFGFSSVLEFSEAPVKVVLGDSQAFLVEKLDRSLILKPLVSDAATNLFVYFRTQPPRLFLLRAGDEVQPTLYKKFTPSALPSMKASIPQASASRVSSVHQPAHRARAQFDPKKDYLTVDVTLKNDSPATLTPEWDSIRLVTKGRAEKPMKLWAERKQVQRDTQVKLRVIFTKPDVPRDLKGVSLSIPVQGRSTSPIRIALEGQR